MAWFARSRSVVVALGLLAASCGGGESTVEGLAESSTDDSAAENGGTVVDGSADETSNGSQGDIARVEEATVGGATVAATELLESGGRASEIPGLVLVGANLIADDTITLVEFQVQNTGDASANILGSFEPTGGVGSTDPLDNSIAGLTLLERDTGRRLTPRTTTDTGTCACSYVDFLNPGATATWWAEFEPLDNPQNTIDLAIPRFGVVTLTLE